MPDAGVPKQGRLFVVKVLVFATLCVACMAAWITPPLALLVGLVISFFPGNPFPQTTQKTVAPLLQAAIILLGFGMNFEVAASAGMQGFWVTLFSIAGVLGLGILLGKKMGADKETALLVGGGTAICGGSAIAALSKAIDADKTRVSLSLATVFILNAAGLVIFPVIGRLLELSQSQFGWWAALAIHDTSSVVGAAAAYGPEALEIATTIKLVRAIWIVPLALAAGYFAHKKRPGITVPWFILGFVAAMLLGTYVPAFSPLVTHMPAVGKAIMTLVLFFIGTGAGKDLLDMAGSKTFLLGLALWILVSVLSLVAVYFLVV
jgi:uncharacterized integral membrane protein (TIGR00698 family)